MTIWTASKASLTTRPCACTRRPRSGSRRLASFLWPTWSAPSTGRPLGRSPVPLPAPRRVWTRWWRPSPFFSSALHAHRTALTVHTILYRNGSVNPLQGAAFLSHKHQRTTLFQPTQLLPGDRLTMSTTYDTFQVVAAGRPAPVWGLATADEVLLSALLVPLRPVRIGPHASPGDVLRRLRGGGGRRRAADVVPAAPRGGAHAGRGGGGRRRLAGVCAGARGLTGVGASVWGGPPRARGGAA